MNISPPLVSVIIPCYNCEKTIIETIQSVYNQTITDYEIILVNDGSTDNTEKIIFNELSKNKNLIYIKHENVGVSKTRNIGAEKASGTFFLFLDADDLIEPTYLEKSVSILQIHKQVKIVYSKAYNFERYTTEWKLPKFNFKSFLFRNCIYITALHRACDFREAGGFDSSLILFEDWDLWISILKNGGDVYQIPEYLFKYRRHLDENSAIDKASKSNSLESKSRLHIYLKHYDLYEKYNYSFLEIIYSLKYKKKYLNIWYIKFLYKFFNQKKYKKLYHNSF